MYFGEFDCKSDNNDVKGCVVKIGNLEGFIYLYFLYILHDPSFYPLPLL